MKEDIDEFVQQIPSITEKTPAVLIEYFVYFITVILKEDAANPAGVERCFELVRIQKYSNISSYLSRNSKRSKSAPSKFLKTKVGYQLERGAELEIQKTLHIGPARQETSHLLRGLLAKFSSQQKRALTTCDRRPGFVLNSSRLIKRLLKPLLGAGVEMIKR